MASVAAALGYLVGMVVLVAMALGSHRVGLLAGAPLLAAATGLVVLLVAGRAAARENTGTRRTAVLNARTPELIVKTGWHLLLLVVAVALVVSQLVLQVGRRADSELLADLPLAAQVLGLGLVVVLWALLSRAAVLRPTLAEADVAVDNALRRSDAARATRLAAICRSEKPRILLDAVGDQIAADIFTAMPAHSRWISYGLLSATGPRLPIMRQFVFDNKRIEGFWLSRWLPAASTEMRRTAEAEVLSRFGQGLWRTEVGQRLSLKTAISHLPEAIKAQGKVMIVPDTV